MTKKSPAFQFYPDSWLASTDIQLMTPAEEGAYVRLLCHAWLQPDCGLPSDDRALASLSRLGSAWRKSADKIRSKFTLRDGRLFNERLLAERAKQENWKKKSSVGGQKGAAARWSGDKPTSNHTYDQSVTTASPHGLPNDDIPSPSPSPITTDHSGFGIVADSARDEPENPPDGEPDGPEVEQIQRLLASTLSHMRGGEEALAKLRYPDAAIARRCLAAVAERPERACVLLLEMRSEKAPDSWAWFPRVLRERAARPERVNQT